MASVNNNVILSICSSSDEINWKRVPLPVLRIIQNYEIEIQEAINEKIRNILWKIKIIMACLFFFIWNFVMKEIILQYIGRISFDIYHLEHIDCYHFIPHYPQ